MTKPTVPSYCLHRPTGQSFATLRTDGKRSPAYFGKWGTTDSVVRYEAALRTAGYADDLVLEAVEVVHRLCANATNQPPPSVANPSTCTVRSLWSAFYRWAQGYYRLPTGEPSRELDNFRDAVRELLLLFGDRRASAMTKSDVEQVRTAMIDRKLSRGVINKRVNKIVRIFVWGTEEERGLVPEVTAAHIKLIRRLEAHRTEAAEYGPVVGVDPKVVESAASMTNPVVAAMMRLQLLTGMRPGEVRGLRKRMVVRIDGEWAADFGIEHKMAYRKQTRVVALGPKAMVLLRGWLKDCPSEEAFVFRPTQQKGSRRKLQQFTRYGYADSVRWACGKAGVEPFAPNQIRHTVGEQVRKTDGLEAVQAVLGHKSRASSERYAPTVTSLAKVVAKRRG